jgi:hypothetical protein
MTWIGYYEYDGTEIINVARTEVYAASAPWFTAAYKTPLLREYLGDDSYTNAATDNAPWYDSDIPESAQFWGFYPLGVVGAEDSSRTSEITEYISDGGNAGRVRHATKALVFNGVLLGANERAVAYGKNWLARALLGAECSTTLTTQDSEGATLRYLDATPYVTNQDSGPQAMMIRESRYLHHVTVNVGPTVTSKRNMSCGGTAWSAQFTAVAGNPFESGSDTTILQGWLDPSVTEPYGPGVTPGTIAGPNPYVEVPCGDNLWAPIYDPSCGDVIVPPAPPSVPLGCFDLPASWERRIATIPGDLVPRWGQVMPTVDFYAPSDLRNLRVRFYQNPDNDLDTEDNPCSYIGDFVVSYIPAGATLEFNAVLEEITVTTSNGHRRHADSLVFGTNGKPFDWPGLTCGFGYIMTLDLPAGQPLPVVNLALTPRFV